EQAPGPGRDHRPARQPGAQQPGQRGQHRQGARAGGGTGDSRDPGKRRRGGGGGRGYGGEKRGRGASGIRKKRRDLRNLCPHEETLSNLYSNMSRIYLSLRTCFYLVAARAQAAEEVITASESDCPGSGAGGEGRVMSPEK